MGVVINDSRISLDDKAQSDVEISNHHHHVLPPSLYSIDIIITIYSIITDDRRNVIGGKFGGSAEIEAVQKAANEKSLHQSKSRAQGVETRRASLDRDQFTILLLLCLYLTPLLQTEPSLCLLPLLLLHTTGNGRLLSVHRLMETRQ